MPQSWARILVPTVFSTKDRRPLLRDTALRQELHHCLGGILKPLDCQPIIVGGSFQDEFRRLLKRYEPAYDERYVWD